MAENEIDVLVKFKADLGNLNSALGAVKTQFNQLTLGNAKLSQMTGKALPELSQQLSVLKVLGAQGDATAKSMVNLAQGTKTFYSVFSGNAKQNLAALFRSNLATKQTIADIGNELKNVQVISQKTGATMTSFADNWALKTRTMANVYIESLHRHAVAWVTAGKQLQWVGRQMIVGITAPIAALAYVTGKAAIGISRAETQLSIFMQSANKSALETTAIVENKLSPALRTLGEDLGITWEETENMAASWAAAGYSATKLLVPVTRLTEELATLAQGDIDVSQAQELVRNINATYYSTTTKGIKQTREQVEALQVIQSTTALQMKDIVGSLPIVTQIGKGLGLSATELTAMLAGMRQLGVDANIAGTALRNSFSQLAKPSQTAADLFKKTFGTGIENIIYGPNGKARGLSAIQQLADMFTTLNQEQRNELTTSLFGSRQAARMNALFDSMTNSQSDYAKSLAATADKTENTTFWNKQLDTVMGSLAKTWDKIKVKLGNVAASLGKTLLPRIEGVADAFVSMAEGIDDLLTKFPSLADWLVRIAGLAAALGPAIFALGQFKLLFGSIGTGITGLGRQIFKVTSSEAPGVLQQAIAQNSGNLPLAIAGGLPSPMLAGTNAANIGDYQRAISTMGAGLAGPGASAYPARAVSGQVLAAQRLGGGQVGAATHDILAGMDTAVAAKLTAGAALTPDEMKKAVDMMSKINGDFLNKVEGDTIDGLRRANSDAVDALFKSGQVSYYRTPSGGAALASKTQGSIGAAGLKKEIQDHLDSQMIGSAFGTTVSAAAKPGVSEGAVEGLMTGNVAKAQAAIKKEASKQSGLSWLFNIMAGKPEAQALKDAEMSGEKTATTFMGRIRSGVSTAGKKGGSFLDLFSDKKTNVLTSGEKGFATIAMQFTSILPELILLVGAAVVVFKNWESIWAGLEAPMQVVMDTLKEIGQIWMQAFDNILGSQNGNGINEFWKELGAEIGRVAIQITEFLKLLSTGLAPTIAWVAKTILQAVEAFIDLFSIITTGTAGLEEFISGGTSVAAKIVAIIAVIVIATKAVIGLRAAFVAMSEAQGIIASISAGFSSLGTLGVVAIIAAIATAFSLLTQKSKEARDAIESAQTSLATFTTDFAQFLSASKGQSMDEFASSAKSVVASMSEVVGKIIEAKDIAGDWGENTSHVKDVMVSMTPVLESLSKLSDKQLVTFRKMVQAKENELAIEKLLKDAQVASLENTLANSIATDAGVSVTTEQIQSIMAANKAFAGSFGAIAETEARVLALGGKLGPTMQQFAESLSSEQFASFFEIIKNNQSALQPIIDDAYNLGEQIKFFNKGMEVFLRHLNATDATSSIGDMASALDTAKLKVDQLGDAGKSAGDKLKEAAKAAKEAFQSAYESQLAQTTDRVTSAILDAFDKQTQAMQDAIDKQIEAIQKQNDKEEWLQQQREYRQERLKMLYDNEISLATIAAERQKALNEGRFDDARLLELQALQQQTDQNKALDDLDHQHHQAVKDRATQKRIDELNKEKDHLQKVRDQMRTRLANILAEVTEFGARTKKEWLQMYQKMNGTAASYGLTIQQTAHSFFQAWGHTVNADLTDAFHDAQVAAAREAEKTGKAVVDGFQDGLSKSKGFKLLAQAGKLYTQLQSMATPDSHSQHGASDSKNFYDLTSSKRYQTLSTQFWNIMDKISGGTKHTGGEITGRKKGDVPIVAQEGEFVIRRDAVKKIGVKNLHKWNNLNEYHDGGIVSGTRDYLKTGTAAAQSAFSGGTSAMLAGAGATFVKSVGESLSAQAGKLLPASGLTGPTGPTSGVKGTAGRNGATRSMSTLYDWIVDNYKIGGYLGVGHLTTGSTGYSQHAYGNAVDFFGTAGQMMNAFKGIIAAVPKLHGLLGHIIHAGYKWSWNGGYGVYDPPPGTSDLHYGHVHVDALPEYGGTPPGYPLPQSEWYSKGGKVRRTGGRVHAGEYVIKTEAANLLGSGHLDALNGMTRNMKFGAPSLLGTSMRFGGKNNPMSSDIIIKINIDQFYGDEGSYRKLYDTLERVGSKVARERGLGNTIVRLN